MYCILICIRSLGQEVSLEKEVATLSSILAWETPWAEGLEDYNPWCCRDRHNWATKQQQENALYVYVLYLTMYLYVAVGIANLKKKKSSIFSLLLEHFWDFLLDFQKTAFYFTFFLSPIVLHRLHPHIHLTHELCYMSLRNENSSFFLIFLPSDVMHL